MLFRSGIEITILSEGITFTFPDIKSTEDWKNIFVTEPGNDFRLDVQAGSDQFIAQFQPATPFNLVHTQATKSP